MPYTKKKGRLPPLGVILTPCSGQRDYAAIAATCALNSNSIGLT
jgi:hypothetical protein